MVKQLIFIFGLILGLSNTGFGQNRLVCDFASDPECEVAADDSHDTVVFKSKNSTKQICNLIISSNGQEQSHSIYQKFNSEIELLVANQKMVPKIDDKGLFITLNSSFEDSDSEVYLVVRSGKPLGTVLKRIFKANSLIGVGKFCFEVDQTKGTD